MCVGEQHHWLDSGSIRTELPNLCVAMRIRKKSLSTKAISVPATLFSEMSNA